jgi:hypothetical protein
VYLEGRLRGRPGLNFRRQGNLIDFGWCHASLLDWADANQLRTQEQLTECAR